MVNYKSFRLTSEQKKQKKLAFGWQHRLHDESTTDKLGLSRGKRTERKTTRISERRHFHTDVALVV